MSVFRPLNSDESNLFTVRCCFKWSSAPTSFNQILADQSTSSNNTNLETPTYNNLPTNFKVTMTAAGEFEIEYGKSFTSHPTIFAMVRSADANTNATAGDALIPCISKKASFNIVAGISDAVVSFRDKDGTNTSPPAGFELIIVGPIKVGVTTGNSNKGWSVGSGNDPSTVYSYLDIGVNTGSPQCAVDINGGFRTTTLALTTTTVDGATATPVVTAADSGKLVTLEAATTYNLNLPTPSAGLNYKFVVVESTLTADITIKSTSDGSSATNLFLGYLTDTSNTEDRTTPVTTVAGTITIAGGTSTKGDTVECICDGTNWFITSNFSSAGAVYTGGSASSIVNAITTLALTTTTVDGATATPVVTAADSGKLVTLEAATTYNLNLPTPSAGLNYKFVVVESTLTADITIKSTSDGSSATNLFLGYLTDTSNTEDRTTPVTTVAGTITIAGGTSTKGDTVECICDGTNWFITSNFSSAGAVYTGGSASSIVNAITTDTTLTTANSGQVIVLNDATGAVSLTLPVADGSGISFKIVVGTTNINSYKVKVGDNTDEFVGTISMLDLDGSDVVAFNAAGAGDNDEIELNGTTTGGLIGDTITVTSYATNKWFVSGILTVPSTSAPATPFATGQVS